MFPFTFVPINVAVLTMTIMLFFIILCKAIIIVSIACSTSLVSVSKRLKEPSVIIRQVSRLQHLCLLDHCMCFQRQICNFYARQYRDNIYQWHSYWSIRQHFLAPSCTRKNCVFVMRKFVQSSFAPMLY